MQRQRRQRDAAAAELREQILEAMLCVCGERGYQAVAVRDVYEHYGGYRMQFYSHFSNKAECYALAYEWGIERLWRRLAGACEAAQDWTAGLQAALEELAAFIGERDDLARGLLAEAHVATLAPVRAKRSEVLERLTRAVDGARRETSRSRHSPPPITATFMVCAIEESVVASLTSGESEEFAATVPVLVGLCVSLYFGE